jgi:hypothetical protein
MATARTANRPRRNSLPIKKEAPCTGGEPVAFNRIAGSNVCVVNLEKKVGWRTKLEWRPENYV